MPAASRLQLQLPDLDLQVDIVNGVFQRGYFRFALRNSVRLLVVCINPDWEIFDNVLFVPKSFLRDGVLLERVIHRPKVVSIRALNVPFITYST